MSDVKVQRPTSPIQQEGMKDRLDALGIEVDDGDKIKPESVEQLRSGKLEGAQALDAVTKDGVLTYDATAQLTRGAAFASVMRGRTASIDEKQTNALRSLMMALDGVGGALRGALKSGDSPSVASLQNLNRRAGNLEELWNKALPKGKGMGRIDPAVVEEFAGKLVNVGQLAVDLTERASQTRQAVADYKIEGFQPLTRVQKLFAQSSCSASVRTLDALRSVSQSATGREFEPGALVSATLNVGPEFGPIGTGAGTHQRLANEAVGGVFSRAGVVEAAGTIQTLSLETKMPPEVITDGLKTIIGADFVKARNGAGAELLAIVRQYSATVQDKDEDEISDAELAESMRSHTFFTDVLSEIGRAHVDDPDGFTKAVTEAAKDDKKLGEWVSKVEAHEYAEPNAATKSAPGSTMRGLEAFGNVLLDAEHGDIDGLKQQLGSAHQALITARTDLEAAAAQVEEGNLNPAQAQRLMVAQDHFKELNGRYFAAMTSGIMSADGVLSGDVDSANVFSKLNAPGSPVLQLVDVGAGESMRAVFEEASRILKLGPRINALESVKQDSIPAPG